MKDAVQGQKTGKQTNFVTRYACVWERGNCKVSVEKKQQLTEKQLTILESEMQKRRKKLSVILCAPHLSWRFVCSQVLPWEKQPRCEVSRVIHCSMDLGSWKHHFWWHRHLSGR